MMLGSDGSSQSSTTTAHDYPLLELFTRLREAGLPLGLGEYQLALRALQGGFGLPDRAALKRLCCTLWVKSAEEKLIFDYHFDQVMVSSLGSLTSRMPSGYVLKHVRRKKTGLKKSSTHQSTLKIVIGLSVLFGVAVILIYILNSRISFWLGNQTPIPQILEQPEELPPPFPEPTAPAQDNAKSNLPIWTLLFIVTLTTGLLSVRWIVKRIAKRSSTNRNSSLKVLGKLQPVSSSVPKFFIERNDEIQVAQSILNVNSFKKKATNMSCPLAADYFPVTSRQMKQGWRHLRYLVREGPRTELDIAATVNRIGRQGIFVGPVLVPRRVNKTQLLLLFDRDGSMIPFNRLSRRLEETAWQTGHLCQVSVYYFHNCPGQYLYQDPNHQCAEPIGQLLNQLSPSRSVVMIFSDAGAVRGGFNSLRVKLTEAFVSQLKQRVRSVTWLNPVPSVRWAGTTAAEIACYVPMFEVNRSNFQQAIFALRRPSKFES